MRKVLAGLLLASLTAGCGSGGNASSSATAGASPAASTAAAPAAQGATRLLETGSTLIYPLMNIWVTPYQKSNPKVQITTQGTGSGAGISQSISGVAQIGASDAYMADSQMKASPMLNIPLAISAQQINYNIPELGNAHLNLSGPVLAGIYSGTITKWNDAAIKKINPALASKLPDATIVPIHRADGSGDTFIFTQYLSFSTPSWKNGPGYGTTISWPAVPSGVGAHGNPGMLQTSQNTKYSVAYIGISFLNQATQANLGYAALQNRGGKFVLPTPQTIGAAAGAMSSKTPSDERISLVYAPGENSYPIVNYEYAIVKPTQSDPNVSKALVAFLTWAISPTGGNSTTYLTQVHFLPLPSAIQASDKKLIAQIK